MPSSSSTPSRRRSPPRSPRSFGLGHSLSFRAVLTSALLALAVFSAVALFSLLPPSSSSSSLSSLETSRSPSKPLVHTSSVATMSLQKQRAVAAVVGGFVADAATMGLHWIYDMDKLRTLVAAAPAPEFHEPPSCPFYEYTSGALSPYGDEVLPLLEFVAAHGAFEPSGYAEASYQAAKHYKGRLNGVFRDLVKKGDAGDKYPNLAVENKDLHGGIKTPVLVAKYLGDTATLVAKTKEATQVHQIGEDATDAAVASALLLQQLVDGATIPSAIKSLTTNEHIGSGIRTLVQEVLDAVESKAFPDATAAIDSFGKSCPLPGSLKGALYVLLTTSGYTAAVRANLVAGGDNCSRSILIGACAAAAAVQDAASADPVPADWKAKTTQFDHVQKLAQQLVQ